MRAFLVLVTGLSIAASAAFAADWPDKPVRVVIPFGAGSATDVIPRIVLDRLGSSSSKTKPAPAARSARASWRAPIPTATCC